MYNSKEESMVLMLNQESEQRVFEISINKLQDNSSHYIVIFTDITAIDKEKNLLAETAYNDPLTQLFNRKMLLREKENQKHHHDSLP